jgi:hypothetical protein
MEDEIPVWALEVRRSWLAPERSAIDLLTSFEELKWRSLEQAIREQEQTRSDGANIIWVERPAFEHSGGAIASAWVVSKSAAETLIIFAFADAREAGNANDGAARLAEEIEFVTPFPADGVESATANGRKLAGQLRARGLPSWWGETETTSYYFGQIGGQPIVIESHREPIDGDPAQGYGGYDRYAGREPSEDEKRSWAVDAEAEDYVYRIETGFDQRGRPTVMEVRELRESGEAVIRRVEGTGPDRRSESIPIGPTFVCPPAESLAHAWVARQESGVWLIQTSALRGTTMTTQLLIPLKPDAEGHRRILLFEDYWPRGMILAFDADGELVYQVAAFGRFDRVSPEEARGILRSMGR